MHRFVQHTMFDHVSTSQGILREQPFKNLPNLIQENLVKIFNISDMKSLVTFLIEMHLHSDLILLNLCTIPIF